MFIPLFHLSSYKFLKNWYSKAYSNWKSWKSMKKIRFLFALLIKELNLSLDILKMRDFGNACLKYHITLEHHKLVNIWKTTKFCVLTFGKSRLIKELMYETNLSTHFKALDFIILLCDAGTVEKSHFFDVSIHCAVYVQTTFGFGIEKALLLNQILNFFKHMIESFNQEKM